MGICIILMVMKFPLKIVGLAASLQWKSCSGKNIIDAGGTANLTSIYLVVWGKNTKYKVSILKVLRFYKDLGEQTLTDPDGGRYQGYRTHYKLLIQASTAMIEICCKWPGKHRCERID